MAGQHDQNDPNLDDTVADLEAEIEVDDEREASFVGDEPLPDERRSDGSLSMSMDGSAAGSFVDGPVESEEREESQVDRDGSEAGLGSLDPELHSGAVRIKSPGLKGALASNEGLFIVGTLCGLVGLSVGIFVAFNHSTVNFIVAGVVVPGTLWISVWRYKRWVGQSPYMAQLLRSVGEREDAAQVEAEHRKKQAQKLERKLKELEAKGIAPGASGSKKKGR